MLDNPGHTFGTCLLEHAKTTCLKISKVIRVSSVTSSSDPKVTHKFRLFLKSVKDGDDLALKITFSKNIPTNIEVT